MTNTIQNIYAVCFTTSLISVNYSLKINNLMFFVPHNFFIERFQKEQIENTVIFGQSNSDTTKE